MTTMKDQTPKAVVLRKDLEGYKLIKRHKNILERWEEMRVYMLLAGKKPACVRLSMNDYHDIDGSVRDQSDGKRDLSMLTYQGVPIYSTESSPQMEILP